MAGQTIKVGVAMILPAHVMRSTDHIRRSMMLRKTLIVLGVILLIALVFGLFVFYSMFSGGPKPGLD
jgi:hypothetical protein